MTSNKYWVNGPRKLIDLVIHNPKITKNNSYGKTYHIAMTASDDPYSKWQSRIMPWAFVQWLKLSKIEEDYILMAEPDHIFLKPLPNLAYEDYPARYPFFYIKPDQHANLIRKFYPEEMGPLTNIDPIGNSPVIIKKHLPRQHDQCTSSLHEDKQHAAAREDFSTEGTKASCNGITALSLQSPSMQPRGRLRLTTANEEKKDPDP
ncbi:voltage-dependent N-type calcium channel subunit alpha-1B [Striga asiatica]|uniref:Voltage-dependent N-type calcium channel subunit alpha-1B n=1 Tax=Striga asiatica TaxID=4170 RepID=A0A5A7PAQ1_STRAF|nr:voltage-dependent N-type calcium channel subunit alpha-1B [Striga asiatica]